MTTIAIIHIALEGSGMMCLKDNMIQKGSNCLIRIDVIDEQNAFS